MERDRDLQPLRVARRIAWFLRDLDWTQAKLAKELGVSAATVSGWVNQGSITFANLERVIRAFGVTEAYFWGVDIDAPINGRVANG